MSNIGLLCERWVPTPVERAIDAETQEQVRTAVNCLPERKRLALKWYNGIDSPTLSFTEIAEAFNEIYVRKRKFTKEEIKNIEASARTAFRTIYNRNQQ